MNVANLVNQWNTVAFNPTTTTLSLSPTTSIVHGSSVNINASVTPSSGSGTPVPTGNVSLSAIAAQLPQARFRPEPILSLIWVVVSSTSDLPGGRALHGDCILFRGYYVCAQCIADGVGHGRP